MVVTMCVVSGLHRTGRWPGGVPPLRCGRLAPMLAVACALLGEGALRPALGVMVTNPTTYWSPVAPLGDLVADRQTGGDEVDLVGNAGTPSFYMAFDGGGTPLLTDGTLAFRARLAGEQTPAGFSSVLFVGMDADLNGVGKTYDDDATWEDLGGFSDPMAPGTLVPEPGSAMLLAAAGALVMRRRRRRA